MSGKMLSSGAVETRPAIESIRNIRKGLMAFDAWCVVHQRFIGQDQVLDIMDTATGEVFGACPFCFDLGIKEKRILAAHKVGQCVLPPDARPATSKKCNMCEVSPVIECAKCSLDCCEKHRYGRICADCAGDYEGAAC